MRSIQEMGEPGHLLENLEDLYELSPMQQGMLFHTIYAPESGAYFEQSVLTIKGVLDVAAFERAWQEMVVRHSILRTSFLWEDLEKPLQAVNRRVDLPIEKHDWRRLGKEQQDQRLEKYIAAERQAGFDLSVPPLMRLALFRIADAEYRFLFSRHHLLMDRWARSVLLKELFTAYGAFATGQKPRFESTRPYGAYIAWLLGQDRTAAENYWRRTLRGFTSPTGFGVDQKRDEAISEAIQYDSQYIELGETSTEALHSFARRHKLTLNTVVQGAWVLLLSRYDSQDDVVLGVTVAGRPADLSGVESMVGLFINTLPLRTSLPRQEPILVWLKGLQEKQAELRQYEYSSLLDIQGWSELPRSEPLFESIFVFENLPIESSFQSPDRGFAILQDRGIGSHTGYPLTVLGGPGTRLTIEIVYDRARFSPKSIEQMLGHLDTILDCFVNHPTLPLSEIALLNESERRKILIEWNNTQTEFAGKTCIHEVFEKQTAQTPDAIALVFEDQELTYAELNARSNQVAHYLLRRGVGPEDLVAVCVERSLHMVVSLLGIMKAGAAYVPVDPSYPAERVAFLIEDSRARVLLTQGHLKQSLPLTGSDVICVDSNWNEIERESTENPSVYLTDQNAAYVLYTSGSTGRPKGVISHHAASLNRFEWMWRTYPFASHEVCCQKTALSFGDSTWELFGPLLKGIRVVIIPDGIVKDPERLVETLGNHRVSRIVLVPSLLRVILDLEGLEQRLPNLKYWTCSGESLPTELARLLKQKIPDSVLLNLYGSSEVAADVTCYEVADPNELATIPIGRPISNTTTYVLDSHFEPVPVGVTGDLYIGGAGLARGYLAHPELTAEKFLPNPSSSEPGGRLYKTGDLARYEQDGTIDYRGRADYQVKLRGYRIELGEIEAVVKAHPAVSNAIVVVSEANDGNKNIVCYVIPKSGPETIGDKLDKDLANFVKLQLPEYMIPRVFVVLEKFPLTPSGKIDRRSLPAPDYSVGLLEADFVAPRTPVEELLAEIWAKVLGVERVGAHDNFFDLGGHSLLATQVISRLRENFDTNLPLRLLFESPTVSALAEKIEASQRERRGLEPPPLVQVSRDQPLPVSFAQQRLWFLDQLAQGSSFYNITRAIRLIGLLNLRALSAAIAEIVKRHEPLRTSFVSEGGMPFQHIAPFLSHLTPVLDFTEIPEAQQGNAIQLLIAAEGQRPFDLSCDVLLRSRLIRLTELEHVLVITIHHIAGDAWSLGILFRELQALYEAFTEGRVSPLPDLEIQYADFAVWQRMWLQGEVLEKYLAYWRRQLAGAPTVLELPTDRPRPPVQSFRGARLPQSFSAELTKSLRALSRREGTTLFMTCLAAFQFLLSRYTGKNDLIVGTDVANRNRVETERMIGFFVNLLPLRIKLTDSLTFTQLLARVKEVTLETYANQDLPFEKLVEELRPDRDLSRNPLVQVLLVMQNAPASGFQLSGLTLEPFTVATETSRFDLALFLWENENTLEGGWVYKPDLFDSQTIASMSQQFEQLLASIVRDPSLRLNRFEMFSETQAKEKIMAKDERQNSQIDNLKRVRRRGFDLSPRKGIKSSYLQASETLPLVIEPENEDMDLPDWGAWQRDFIEDNLLKHGAMLFRGFNLESVAEFERFAASVCPELFGEYGDLPREEVGGKVYSSTPYPSDETILFHNESSHMHRWPMLIWFCCIKAAERGGETPIVDCRKIYREIDPEIRDRFEKLSLMYVRNFTKELDVSWENFFRTSDKMVVEDYCRQAGIDFEWKANGLRTRQICPAVVKHPQTGEKVFFNQLQLHHISCLTPAVRESLLAMMKEEDLPRNVYYGDGSPIPDEVIDQVRELYKKVAVSFSWKPHDVLLLNNMLVAHARNPYVGQRKIVVAMGRMITKEQVAQV